MDCVEIKDFLQNSKTLVHMENVTPNFVLCDLSIDSRTVKSGDVFVAIKGERLDGHHFLDEAIRNGASAVVVNNNTNNKLNSGPYKSFWVTDTTDFLLEFSGWYRSQFQIPIIGITGSTGKTTTKEFLAAVLQTEMQVLKTEGNMNNYIGVPLTLLNIGKNANIAVIEMGTNHPGEISQLTKTVKPTIATVTNIGVGHIGFFGTKEAIYEEKKAIFDQISSHSTIFINTEDELLKNYRRNDVIQKKVGLRNDLDYQGEYLGVDNWGRVCFRMNSGPEIQLQVPGKHQLMNGLLAAAVSAEVGITNEHIKEGLETNIVCEKRMEIYEKEGVIFINDAYNSNPQSLEAAINYLSEFKIRNGGRKILVLGDMLELGDQSEELHRHIGNTLKKKPVNFIYGYGNFSQFIIEEAGTRNSQVQEAVWFETHKGIANKLKEILKTGDVVLVKGSRGMEMEKVLMQLGIRR